MQTLCVGVRKMLRVLWPAMLAAILVLILGLAAVALLWKKVLDLLADCTLKRLITDPYLENITEMLTVAGKFSPQGLIEAEIRSATGKALERPFGSAASASKWEFLRFNPVYLARLPLRSPCEVETGVVIGPQARRPLSLGMPIMIGGMSYGSALSVRAKIALARGASMVGTCTNTGNGPFLPEEREAASKLVIQYSRGPWLRDDELLMQADMIEIAFGQGSTGGAPINLPAQTTQKDPRFARLIGVRPGEESMIPGLFPDIHDTSDLKRLVNRLRSITGGAPIGVKFGATQYLEQDLDIFIEAGVDAVAICGAEGGTHGGPPAVLDSYGIPTLPAAIRAGRYFEKHGLKGKVSLLIGGGLTQPAHFLKAMALGADAVFIGTAAVIGISHTQALTVLPWEPPTQLIYNTGKSRDRYDPEKGACSLANFLMSCNEEMRFAAAGLGRRHVSELCREDLSTTDPDLALAAEVANAWKRP